MIDGLMQELGDRLHVQSRAGGIHVLAHLNTGENDISMVKATEARGLAVHALSNWRMRKSTQGGLIMGFTNFTTAKDAMDSVQQLKEALLDIS